MFNAVVKTCPSLYMVFFGWAQPLNKQLISKLKSIRLWPLVGLRTFLNNITSSVSRNRLKLLQIHGRSMFWTSFFEHFSGAIVKSECSNYDMRNLLTQAKLQAADITRQPPFISVRRNCLVQAKFYGFSHFGVRNSTLEKPKICFRIVAKPNDLLSFSSWLIRLDT